MWLLRNVGDLGRPVLARPEVVPLEAGEVARFGGHSCVPAPCRLGGPAGRLDTGNAGTPDLLVGSENGRVYAFARAYARGDAAVHAFGAELPATPPAP